MVMKLKAVYNATKDGKSIKKTKTFSAVNEKADEQALKSFRAALRMLTGKNDLALSKMTEEEIEE